MLSGYGAPSGEPAGRGEQTQATHSNANTNDAKRERQGESESAEFKRARPGEQEQTGLQTPPRPAAAVAGAAREEKEEGERPSVKPIYFIGEYVPEEEMVAEVNAGGTRFTLPRTALRPLMSTPTVSGVPNPRRLGDVFLDVSPLVFEPLARLLVLPPPPPSDSPGGGGGLFGRHSPCPRPPPLAPGQHLDPLAWHLTLASLGLCRPPSSSEEKKEEGTAGAMATGGAAAAQQGDVMVVEEEEGGMMAVARDEEELGETEAWPQSDPLVDVYMENGGPIQTCASTLMQGPSTSAIRAGIASRLRHAPLRVYIPGPPACVALLLDYLRLRAMAARLQASGASPTACTPSPPQVPPYLAGDWKAFLTLVGLGGWAQQE